MRLNLWLNGRRTAWLKVAVGCIICAAGKCLALDVLEREILVRQLRGEVRIRAEYDANLGLLLNNLSQTHSSRHALRDVAFT